MIDAPRNLTDQFTLDQKRTFVMRHVAKLAAWQEPDTAERHRLYVGIANEDWINKAFMHFAENYDFDKNLIAERCR